mmetsp:Transcript_92475/g.211694  ORF Transcript_92475/g.211694 Transcript_92475/m.211694 type:complete len:334 (-) Transcript_92475:451-1452(-)
MVKIFPGFMMFNGSIAFLMFLITFTCTSPCSAFMYFIFPSPTPCSPVHVPPAANASSTAFLSHAIMVARSDSLYGTSRWKFPSAMWQHMIGGRPHPLNTASVCAITSGKLDKGTQQSPGYTLSASGRSFQSFAAKKHPRLASHKSSIFDPSSASVYPVQPCFFAICSVFLASSMSWSTLAHTKLLHRPKSGNKNMPANLLKLHLELLVCRLHPWPVQHLTPSKRRNHAVPECHYTPSSSTHILERDQRSHTKLWQSMYTPSKLGDHAKGPLGTSEQLRQVIPGRRLPHQPLGLHQVPVRKHHLQRHQVLTRCAILQSGQARSACGSHPSHGGV